MKFSTVIAAVATAFAAVGASAQEATYELPQPVVSQTTRAAVNAQLQQARVDGTLQVTEWDRQAATPSVSIRSRADVQAEARAARASGASTALAAEPHGFDGGVAAHGKGVAPKLVAAVK
jgi:hypothetical protein